MEAGREHGNDQVGLRYRTSPLLLVEHIQLYGTTTGMIACKSDNLGRVQVSYGQLQVFLLGAFKQVVDQAGSRTTCSYNKYVPHGRVL